MIIQNIHNHPKHGMSSWLLDIMIIVVVMPWLMIKSWSPLWSSLFKDGVSDDQLGSYDAGHGSILVCRVVLIVMMMGVMKMIAIKPKYLNYMKMRVNGDSYKRWDEMLIRSPSVRKPQLWLHKMSAWAAMRRATLSCLEISLLAM